MAKKAYRESDGREYDVPRWVCPCGFSAGYNPDRYFAHQDSGNCPVWPGFKPKKPSHNRLGGLKAPALRGYAGLYKGMTA